MYTTNDLCKMWQCSRQTIYRRIASGELEYVKGAPKYRFTIDMIKKAEGTTLPSSGEIEKMRRERDYYREKNKEITEFLRSKLGVL